MDRRLKADKQKMVVCRQFFVLFFNYFCIFDSTHFSDSNNSPFPQFRYDKNVTMDCKMRKIIDCSRVGARLRLTIDAADCTLSARYRRAAARRCRTDYRTFDTRLDNRLV